MKVIQETPTTLVLKQSAIGGIIMGAAFVVVGLLVAIFFSKTDWKILILSGVFILFGLVSVLLTKFITVKIDKSTNKITILHSGILGKKSYDLAIDQLKEVAVEESVSVNYSNQNNQNSTLMNGSGTQRSYNLVFYLMNGQGIPVQMDSSSLPISINGLSLGMLTARNKNIELGNKIAVFIGVPFVDRRPPGIADVVSGLKNLVQVQSPTGEPTQQV